jgi:hypothetical protein
MPIPSKYPIKHAKIDTATSGNTTIVAAVTGKYIVVIGYLIVADAAVDVKFQSGTGGTDLTGPLGVAANGGAVYAGGIDCPAFETAKSTLLNLNLNGAIQVSGHITYLEV